MAPRNLGSQVRCDQYAYQETGEETTCSYYHAQGITSVQIVHIYLRN